MNAKTKRMIITVKKESLQASLREFNEVDPAGRVEQWIEEEVGLVRLHRNFQEIAHYFQEKPPIFIQHLCPVQRIHSLENQEQDLDQIREMVAELMSQLDLSRSFSVQTRILSSEKKPYKRFAVNQQVSQFLEEKGYVLDVANPQQVISIVLSDDQAYIGISLAKENLSAWAGGKHRFAYEENQISRAEFKLLEAWEVFSLPLVKKGVALDLGAAPGGWARVLRNHGYQVHAVDPAELHPSLQKDKQVIHYQQTIQTLMERGLTKQFDLIVNDMRMDSQESVYLMGKLAHRLKPDGIVIMTLKLQRKQVQRQTRQAIERLKKWYALYGAKQLFHNRSEVTVILKRKPDQSNFAFR